MLVYITKTFDDENGRRRYAGETQDVPRELAERWMRDRYAIASRGTSSLTPKFPGPSKVGEIQLDGLGALRGGSMGRLVCNWATLSAQVNGTLVTIANQQGVLKAGVRIVRSASVAFAESAVALAPYTPAKGKYPALAFEIANPTNRVLDFKVRVWNASGKAIVYGGSVKPTGGALKLMSMSPKATIADTGWNFTTPDQIVSVRVDQRDDGPNGPWVAGDELTFGEVSADAKGKARFLFSFDDVPANAVRRSALTVSSQPSGLSTLEMLAYFKLKAIFYIVPTLVGGSSTNITVEEVLTIQRAGHVIGSHSLTHPIDAIGAGLRLLGPYGYNRSRASRAANAIEAATTADCRVISTNSSTGTFTTEGAHQMLTGGKLVFFDPLQLPTGCTLNTTYYVINTGASTFKLATTAGLANAGTAITLPSNWTGLAEWRWPGSRPDDTAIYEDVMGGINGLTALGLTGHEDFFALPQGGWDHFVRTAVERTPVKHTRGIASPSSNHRTVGLGWATGGTASSTPYLACGWPQQQDAMTSDQGATAEEIIAYMDDGIDNGYTMANYHHSMTDTTAVLHAVMAAARTRIDAGTLENPTLEEMMLDMHM